MLAEFHFVDAIRNSPDDQSLRLVYADWLDDAGDTRGELIRLQCELAGFSRNQPERNVLYQAIQNRILQSQAHWLAPLRKRVLAWEEADIKFGLIENVAMSPAAFLTHAESGLFEEMPHLVGVWLKGSEKPLLAALASPHVSRLCSLKLSVFGSFDRDNFLKQFAAAEHVGHLTSLDLGHCDFGDAAISHVWRSERFPKLRRLDLRNNSLTAATAEDMAESPLLGQLEQLSLGSHTPSHANRLGDFGVRRWLESSPPLQLRRLDLAANELSDSSAWDLANCTGINHLERLQVEENRFRPASRTALVARFSHRVVFTKCPPVPVLQLS